MWRHYIYIHFRESDGVPFYVGKGSIRLNRKFQNYERACIDHASSHWKNVVDKHGIAINIIMSCATDIEAQEQEKRIILDIGRVDLGTGSLINKTDGGDGHCGLLVSDELKKKRSANASRIRSIEWIASIREARKDGGNGGVVKHGDKLPESWRANLAAAKVGSKNPWFGIPSPLSKKVKNVQTGVVYYSINRAAKAEGINAKTLYQYLDGSRVNKTSLRRI